jgi:HD-like signal output (HDOD) protein
MVSRKMAQLVRYPDPEKAYLAGLLHDMGILVNTMTCAEESRACLDSAIRLQAPIDRCEQQQLGFTHCDSGSVLAQQWHFSPDVISAIEFHHKVHAATNAHALVSLIHLSDLLCRLRNLGYGYYEAMAVDLATDAAWAMLLKEYPTLRNMDVVRLTLDIDAAMEEITAVVDAVFKAS